MNMTIEEFTSGLLSTAGEWHDGTKVIELYHPLSDSYVSFRKEYLVDGRWRIVDIAIERFYAATLKQWKVKADESADRN
jgi:hypothetical protein